MCRGGAGAVVDSDIVAARFKVRTGYNEGHVIALRSSECSIIVATIGMLVWANGAYGVMDIFGYMGDVLSYARLLALCLATGGIAMTVNILAQMIDQMVPFVGIVLAIIIFIFGHIANFLFQVLGAFINALRLNYVEFFSQFFMEGKGKFEAFKAKRTFTKIKN